MDRRRFLAIGSTALSVLGAGCTAPSVPTTQSGTKAKNETATESVSTEQSMGGERTPDRRTDGERTKEGRTAETDDIEIVVENGKSSAITVTLVVRTDSTRVFNETITVEEGVRRGVEPDITETGAYELVVDVEGDDESVSPFHVEDYDLRMGSNLIVHVDTVIRVIMEE
jgi:hypothetical protein